ncbi:MAG: biopolymer transporter ExbD [Elusimicrobia bacterium]|nr:biopolymer transporter ExbD [Elusimicrobiota bacterium]
MAGAQQSEDGEITDINVTPLVDVCLVLVIIFMAVAPFAVTAGIKVLETRAKAAEGKTAATENVQVKLTVEGKLTINGKPATFDGLPQALLEAITNSKDKMVIVTADVKNKVGQVVTILDTAKQNGAQKLAIMREETAPPAGAHGG